LHKICQKQSFDEFATLMFGGISKVISDLRILTCMLQKTIFLKGVIDEMHLS